MKTCVQSCLFAAFFLLWPSKLIWCAVSNFDQTIDVVIPCAPKDKKVLQLCIDGIRENGRNIRNVYVVSPERLTDKAEWIKEDVFPFTKKQVALEICGDKLTAMDYINNPHTRVNWVYQQLLTLYSPLVIENISQNVLLLDADTVFLRPVSFIDCHGNPYLTISREHHKPYFDHMSKLIPGLERKYKSFSGIAHHMLMQRCVLEELFKNVYEYHHKDFWKAFCACIAEDEWYGCGCSEYEIYFNFVVHNFSSYSLREMPWANLGLHSLALIDRVKKQGCYFASFHNHPEIRN